MGNPKGFIEVVRKVSGNRPVNERVDDYGEVEQVLNDQDRRDQASRCMDCGIPFCHWACPVGSKIPEWQDALYKGDYALASSILHSTNSLDRKSTRLNSSHVRISYAVFCLKKKKNKKKNTTIDK